MDTYAPFSQCRILRLPVHLVQEMVPEVCISGESPRQPQWQHADKALDLMQHGIGVGQAGTVLQSGGAGPTYSGIQLLLHLGWGQQSL